jgi:hypothetical protein
LHQLPFARTIIDGLAIGLDELAVELVIAILMLAE